MFSLSNRPAVIQADAPPTRIFLRTKQIKVRFGNASDMWVARRMRDDGFPKPYYLTAAERFWALDEIEAWERERLTQEPPPRSSSPPSRRRS